MRFRPMLVALPLLTAACSITDPADVLILEVAEVRVPCMGVAPGECHVVRFRQGGEPALFHDVILGFDWAPGYRYTLAVTRRRNRNPPADGSSYTYTLNDILAQSRSPRAALIEELEDAEAAWRDTRPPAYEVVQQRVCFCGSAGLGEVRVSAVVTLGGTWEEALSVERVIDGSAVPASLADEFLTVQGLFGFVRWHIAADAETLEAEFADGAGYPSRIHVDPASQLADDEIEYIVESVTPSLSPRPVAAATSGVYGRTMMRPDR